MNNQAIILYADSNRGQYIPQFFAESIKREFVKGVSDSDYQDLSDPDCEWYWDTWDRVLNNVAITIEGHSYSMHHDGDLWLVCDELATFKEKSNLYQDGVFANLESEWQAMINRGTHPMFEYQIGENDYLIVNLEFTDNGIEFSFDSDNKRVAFDGDIKVINDNRYLMPFDVFTDSLDCYLETIHANITEGYLIVNGMLYSEDLTE